MNGESFPYFAVYACEMSIHSVYPGVCEFVVGSRIYQFSIKVYYNQNLYVQFST
jgi:hypothetical protein